MVGVLVMAGRVLSDQHVSDAALHLVIQNLRYFRRVKCVRPGIQVDLSSCLDLRLFFLSLRYWQNPSEHPGSTTT